MEGVILKQSCNSHVSLIFYVSLILLPVSIFKDGTY